MKMMKMAKMMKMVKMMKMAKMMKMVKMMKIGQLSTLPQTLPLSWSPSAISSSSSLLSFSRTPKPIIICHVFSHVFMHFRPHILFLISQNSTLQGISSSPNWPNCQLPFYPKLIQCTHRLSFISFPLSTKPFPHLTKLLPKDITLPSVCFSPKLTYLLIFNWTN